MISLIDELGIDIRNSGANIMREHVGVNCPECGDDPSYHLNIKYDGTHALCFRCGYKERDVINIIKTISGEDLENKDCYELIAANPLEEDEMNVEEEFDDISVREKKFKKLWKSFDKIYVDDDNYYIDYLRDERGIDLHWARKFGIRFGNGRYEWNIILPVRDEEGTIVNFIARNTSDYGRRYDNCETNKSIKEVGACLFGLREAKLLSKKYLVIVEGPFDALVLLSNGIPAIALMKKAITDNQYELLLREVKSNKTIFVCLDAGEDEDARAMVDRLSAHYNKVKKLNIHIAKDSGELPKKEVKSLAKFIRRYFKNGKKVKR